MHGLIIGFSVVLVGCAMTPRLANVSGAEGNKPEQYEQTIREHLRVTLLDPPTTCRISASRRPSGRGARFLQEAGPFMAGASRCSTTPRTPMGDTQGCGNPSTGFMASASP
jgi:hypothetical protein